MNLASLAAFSLYFADNVADKTSLTVVYDEATQEHVETLFRMVRPWRQYMQMRSFSSQDYTNIVRDHDNGAIVFLSEVIDSIDMVEDGRAIVLPVVPDASHPDFGLFQEMESHDYELGGLNEWRENVSVAYSNFVLQSLSSVHIKRSFPFDGWSALGRVTELSKQEKIKCLDVGCGPISRLRWAALQGWIEIVGVDPLNKIYDSIMARHGYDVLPQIRPAETITSAAENMQLDGRKFDVVFSMNALDHTQDLPQAIKTMGAALRFGGGGLISVYSREGTRQEFQGLHKYDIWFENDDIVFKEKDTEQQSLFTLDSSLELHEIVRNTDIDLMFTIKKR